MIIFKESAVPDISRNAILDNKRNYEVTYQNIMPDEHFHFLSHKNPPPLFLDKLHLSCDHFLPHPSPFIIT